MQVGELVSLLIVKLGISIYVYINAAVGDNNHVSVITKMIVERRLNMSDIVVIKTEMLSCELRASTCLQIAAEFA